MNSSSSVSTCHLGHHFGASGSPCGGIHWYVTIHSAAGTERCSAQHLRATDVSSAAQVGVSSSREKGVLGHPKMNPTWAPPRPSQDVNETGSMNFCQFEGRPALPPKVAFIQPPKNGSKTARKITKMRGNRSMASLRSRSNIGLFFMESMPRHDDGGVVASGARPPLTKESG